MREVLITAIALGPTIILSGGAVYLAGQGMPWWVWAPFLLAALINGGSYSYNEKTSTKQGDD